MKNKKYTTEALSPNQFLKMSDYHLVSAVEAYMIGFTDGERDKSLDGYYLRPELTPIS